MGGRSESPDFTNNPGPGHYNPDDSNTKYLSPSYKMNDTQRSNIVSQEKQRMPGPGNYD